jgi:uncharacterized protein YndB with AHSA1/START domain
MNKTIKHSFHFQHSPEIVWDYLTKPELLEQWLMKNDIKPIVGHKFQFVSNPAPAIQFDGMAYCEIVEIQPFVRLSYTWESGPGNGKIILDSIVVWTLTPKDGGTELLLEHSGFKGGEDDLYFTAMHSGWEKRVNTAIRLITG